MTLGLKEKVTYEYIRHVNRRTFCPVCRKSEMRVDRKQRVLRCKNCGYIFPTKQSGRECVFWFCGKCDAYLNIQDNFDENAVKHICSTCGYENSLEKENIKGVCRDCGEILQNPEDMLCQKCIIARKEKSKSVLLAIGKAAVLAVVALGAVWMANPIDDSDDSSKQTILPEDTDDGIEPCFQCANCGNKDENTFEKEDDTIYCKKCCHRTLIETGEDDSVECPYCHRMRDRKAAYCRHCNDSTWLESTPRECREVDEILKNMGR